MARVGACDDGGQDVAVAQGVGWAPAGPGRCRAVRPGRGEQVEVAGEVASVGGDGAGLVVGLGAGPACSDAVAVGVPAGRQARCPAPDVDDRAARWVGSGRRPWNKSPATLTRTVSMSGTSRVGELGALIERLLLDRVGWVGRGFG